MPRKLWYKFLFCKPKRRFATEHKKQKSEVEAKVTFNGTLSKCKVIPEVDFNKLI